MRFPLLSARGLKPLLLAAAAAGLLLMPEVASAFNLLESFNGGGPKRWHDGGNPASNADWYMDPSDEEETVPAGTSGQAIARALAEWQNVSCSSIQFNGGDPFTFVNAQVGERGFTDDGTSAATFNDPFNDLGGGTLAATVTWEGGAFESNNGLNFRAITNMDVIYNDGVNYILAADIPGGCSGRFNLEHISLHEYGHGIGYGHSCESGESCPDTDERNAVMYWAANPCEQDNDEPQADDLAMHSLVYGPNNLTSFDTSAGEQRGVTPFDVDFLFSTFADATGLAAVWTFGDGTTSTDLNPTHSYVDQGRYSVRLELSGDSATCGAAFTHDIFQTDYITACDHVAPTFTFSTTELTANFDGEGSGQDIGCIDRLTWDFGDGTPEIHTRTPQHTYSKEGTYQVSLTAEGPGGVTPAALQSITVKEPGCNCAIAPATNRVPAWTMILMLLAVAGVLIRHRKAIGL